MRDFDIRKHEWSDSDIRHTCKTGGELCFYIRGNRLPIYINKQDAIAIAKHFNLTAEDLERG